MDEAEQIVVRPSVPQEDPMEKIARLEAVVARLQEDLRASGRTIEEVRRLALSQVDDFSDPPLGYGPQINADRIPYSGPWAASRDSDGTAFTRLKLRDGIYQFGGLDRLLSTDYPTLIVDCASLDGGEHNLYAKCYYGGPTNPTIHVDGGFGNKIEMVFDPPDIDPIGDPSPNQHADVFHWTWIGTVTIDGGTITKWKQVWKWGNIRGPTKDMAHWEAFVNPEDLTKVHFWAPLVLNYADGSPASIPITLSPRHLDLSVCTNPNVYWYAVAVLEMGETLASVEVSMLADAFNQTVVPATTTDQQNVVVGLFRVNAQNELVEWIQCHRGPIQPILWRTAGTDGSVNMIRAAAASPPIYDFSGTDDGVDTDSTPTVQVENGFVTGGAL
jgi:hypothetical protein